MGKNEERDKQKLAELLDRVGLTGKQVMEFLDGTSDDMRNAVLAELYRSHPESIGPTLFPGLEQVKVGLSGDGIAELHRMIVREAAKEEFARRQGQLVQPATPASLSDFLEEPDDDEAYRVDKLWPTNGRAVLAAQYKSGKTTVVGNLIRSLADGDPFLDQFAVAPANRIILEDNELSPGQLRRWLRDQGVINTDAVDVLSLRGRLSTFNIVDPVVRSRWAAALGPGDVLLFDCLRPALDAIGLSEDKEAGRFLEALDELTAEASIGELLVVHHMGHTQERSRGDSRILDWPDAVWNLVREDPEDPASARYFKAFGRDVDYPESRLTFNAPDRRLSIGGGSRKTERRGAVETAVLEFVRTNPDCTKASIETAIGGKASPVREAIKHLVSAGQLVQEQRGRGLHHRVAEEFPDDI